MHSLILPDVIPWQPQKTADVFSQNSASSMAPVVGNGPLQPQNGNKDVLSIVSFEVRAIAWNLASFKPRIRDGPDDVPSAAYPWHCATFLYF